MQIHEMSEILDSVRLDDKEAEERLKQVISDHDDWPLGTRLRQMVENSKLLDHVALVIASTNRILDWVAGTAALAFQPVGDPVLDASAVEKCRSAIALCWRGRTQAPPTFGQVPSFPQSFLRAAALYHDIWKLIAVEHHVPRGVHVMCDVSDDDRRAVEALFTTLAGRRCFWSVLSHHDVFGVLNTGEASVVAFSSVVGWTASWTAGFDPTASPGATVSYMLWLNVADSNASLIRQRLGGLPALEAHRYFSDWADLVDFFHAQTVSSQPVGGDAFRKWALNLSARPDRAVQRISRLVASNYRMESERLPDDDQIRLLVEDALQDQHGPRFEEFCLRLAHFCKLDYASRFLRILMNHCAIEVGIAKRVSNGIEYQGNVQDHEPALRTMAYRTCLILGRIVEEYGDLVCESQRKGKCSRSKLLSDPEESTDGRAQKA